MVLYSYFFSILAGVSVFNSFMHLKRLKVHQKGQRLPFAGRVRDILENNILLMGKWFGGRSLCIVNKNAFDHSYG